MFWPTTQLAKRSLGCAARIALHSHTHRMPMYAHMHAEQDDTKYNPGNTPGDGFGHIAFNTADVYAACEELEKNGVTFKKKPDEGRMKGLAFAYDPDG
jgi:4-hydroxyphenylpyruvate dioxygenase-like putative hemolysin